MNYLSSAETPTSNPFDWSKMWNQITDFFSSNVWNIIRFFSVLAIGIIVIFLIMFLVRRAMTFHKVDRLAIRFVSTILRFTLWLVLILILLRTVGLEITGLTTAISAVVLAIGMALKDNISNVANGLLLVTSKKYKTGDYVIVGGVEGSIEEISLMFTCLRTPDGKQIMMPNSTMVNSQVTNVGAYPKRRINITLPVPYEADVELVKKIVIDSMKSDGRVYLDPAPFCRLKTFSSSSIDFFCNCWVDSGDYWDVYYYLMETIFNELKRNGISIPFNQIEVRQRTDVVTPIVHGDKLQNRVEKKRAKKKAKIGIEEIETEHGIKLLRDQIRENQREYKAAMDKRKKDRAKAKKEAKQEAKVERKAKKEKEQVLSTNAEEEAD